MAIYHFSAKVISRANGSSAVASAAYRSASELHDDRLGATMISATRRRRPLRGDVAGSAPERLNDRTTLWNEVEAGRSARTRSLPREVEFSIPREMNEKQGVALAAISCEKQFVDRGMVADLNVHWDKAKDGSPSRTRMSCCRCATWGGRVREEEPRLEQHRAVEGLARGVGCHVNERMAELGLEGRIDHRSYEAQGIELEPQHKIGPAASRRPSRGLRPSGSRITRASPARMARRSSPIRDRAGRHHAQQATFTTRDLAVFAFRHSDGKEQFDQVMGRCAPAPSWSHWEGRARPGAVHVARHDRGGGPA
jgi:hypothetical protein